MMNFQYLKDTELTFPGVWRWAKQLIEDLRRQSINEVPIGGMIFWPAVDPPLNWLACDGATYNTADYPNLYIVLGGSGTTFTVPNVTSPITEQVIIRAR